ncbi:MAG: sulfatase-like hydrolase/transferase, partial [Candidatus Hinthialibacter sp.]
MQPSILNRRSFLKTSSVAATLGASGGALFQTASAESQEKPNIIWLIADDVGYKEIGCYGHPTIRTPNIDRLADNGVRFTDAFVTASSCSPSRCSMFTGKYPHSTGAENLHDPLPADQVMVPELLASAGYYTGSVGKFHMGPHAQKKFDVVTGKVGDWKS